MRVRLVDKPQDAPIFVSLDRVRHCPKEIADGETWSGKRGHKKNLSLNLNLDLTLRHRLLKTPDPGLLDLDPDNLLDEDVLD